MDYQHVFTITHESSASRHTQGVWSVTSLPPAYDACMCVCTYGAKKKACGGFVFLTYLFVLRFIPACISYLETELMTR